jgi:hypothetical protein
VAMLGAKQLAEALAAGTAGKKGAGCGSTGDVTVVVPPPALPLEALSTRHAAALQLPLATGMVLDAAAAR